jgi:hypothetical protein
MKMHYSLALTPVVTKAGMGHPFLTAKDVSDFSAANVAAERSRLRKTLFQIEFYA